jgi:hypothetical protein
VGREGKLLFSIILLARNIVQDVNVTLSSKMYCQCCGMQLRTTPTEREYKEKVNSKKKRERKSKLRLGIVPNTISYYSHKKHR